MSRIVNDGIVKSVKFKSSGNEYSFYAVWRKNNSGFIHEVSMYRNYEQINFCKCQYYNRTWESYEYESCIKGCCYNELEYLKDKLKKDFLSKNDWKKLTKKRAELLEVELNNNSLYQELIELKKAVSGSYNDRVIELD